LSFSGSRRFLAGSVTRISYVTEISGESAEGAEANSVVIFRIPPVFGAGSVPGISHATEISGESAEAKIVVVFSLAPAETRFLSVA
jgi:hypothetical protein